MDLIMDKINNTFMKIIYIILIVCLFQYIFSSCSNWQTNPDTIIPKDTSTVKITPAPLDFWSIAAGMSGDINICYLVNNHPIFAGTSEGKIYYQSLFSPSKYAFLPEKTQINCFAYSIIPKHLNFRERTAFSFAGTDNGLYYSLDSGKIWKKYPNLGQDSSSRILGIQMAGNLINLFGEFKNASKIIIHTDSIYNEYQNIIPSNYKMTSTGIFPNSTIHCLGIKDSSKCGIYLGWNNSQNIAYFDKLSTINSFAFLTSKTTVYAGTNKGIYSTSDFGRTWNLLGLDTIDIKYIGVTTAGLLYATSINRIFVSFDYGSSFLEMTPEYIFYSSISYMVIKDNSIFFKRRNNTFWTLDNPSTYVSIYAPVPCFPSNPTDVLTTPISLYFTAWKNPAYEYQIELSQDQNFDKTGYATTGGSPHVITKISKGKKYYWRVRASFGVYSTIWSEPFSFNS
jgi:hypothetical protein